MSNISENEMMNIIEKSSKKTVNPQDVEKFIEEKDQIDAKDIKITRKLIIIGCGDGGCNIASQISKEIHNETYTIAYNSTTRTLYEATADARIYPKGKDGEGKFRGMSKETFKDNNYMALLNEVNNGIDILGEVSYIILCTTSDGGTGSGMSPVAAKLLSANTNIPVVVFGVLPSSKDDATSQYNAMEWMLDIEKTGVPYILFDNDRPGEPMQVHKEVNAYATEVAKLLAGKLFGNTTISIIDNRNLYMLMERIGGRIVAAVKDVRPSLNETLDQIVFQMLKENYQPAPENVRGIGIFVRGPKDMLAQMDTSLFDVQETYGEAEIKFAHVEEADKPRVAILLTGCDEAADRLSAIRRRYDDIKAGKVKKESVLADMVVNMENPLAGSDRCGTGDGTIDLSALDI